MTLQRRELRGGLGSGLKKFVDECLVWFVLLGGEVAKLRKQPRVNANGNELFGFASFWAPDAASALEFFGARLRNVGEINLAIRNMSDALCGLLDVR